MLQGKNLEFSSSSSASVGNLKGQKPKYRKSFFSKRKKEFYSSILFLATILMILYFLKHENSSIKKTKKIKRHLKTNEFDEDQEMIISKTDIEIIPENRRMSQHPNHRYEETGPDYDVNPLKKLNSRKAFRSSKRKAKNEIREAEYNKFRIDVQDAKGQNKLRNEMLKDLTSMRLKGVYKQTKTKEGTLRSQLSEKQYYLKEINNLMQNSSGGEGEGRKWSPRNTLKSHGVPFQLPTKERVGNLKQKANKDYIHLNQAPKEHPITIYLDFYPTKESENLKKKFKSKPPKRKEFHSPNYNQSVSVEKFVPSKDKRKRMIMKLNLYPGQGLPSKKDFSKRGQSLKSGHNKKGERRSFEWFFKPKTKKDEPKECSIMGFHPHGKHITAKWKNDDGEWIHAKHVTVKYLKK